MSRSAWLVGMVILVSGIAVRGAPPAGAREDHLAALAKFDGEWRVKGQWTNGEKLEARTVYEWGLGRKILKAHTFVKNGAKEYQRYESIMAWHPRRKCLYEISFTYNGDISEHVIDVVDAETLRIGFTSFERDTASPAKPGRESARQVLKFIDGDHMMWTVTTKQGGEWKPLIQATWVRQQPSPQ